MNSHSGIENRPSFFKGSSPKSWAMNESLTQLYHVDDEGFLIVKSYN